MNNRILYTLIILLIFLSIFNNKFYPDHFHYIRSFDTFREIKYTNVFDYYQLNYKFLNNYLFVLNFIILALVLSHLLFRLNFQKKIIFIFMPYFNIINSLQKDVFFLFSIYFTLVSIEKILIEKKYGYCFLFILSFYIGIISRYPLYLIYSLVIFAFLLLKFNQNKFLKYWLLIIGLLIYVFFNSSYLEQIKLYSASNKDLLNVDYDLILNIVRRFIYNLFGPIFFIFFTEDTQETNLVDHIFDYTFSIGVSLLFIYFSYCDFILKNKLTKNSFFKNFLFMFLLVFSFSLFVPFDQTRYLLPILIYQIVILNEKSHILRL